MGDSAETGCVRPEVVRQALKGLLPGLHDKKVELLALAIFGDEASSLSEILNQLALFVPPPRLTESWMQPAIQQLAALIEQQFEGHPRHQAILNFFMSAVKNKSGLMSVEQFIQEFSVFSSEDSKRTGQDPVALLGRARMERLFGMLDWNHTG